MFSARSTFIARMANTTDPQHRYSGFYRFNLAALGIGILAMVGVTMLTHEETTSTTASNNDVTHYDDKIAQLDRNLLAKTNIASQRPDSWLHLEHLADAYLERARLTGKFEDFAASQTILDRAFALTDGHGGPLLTRARLNFSIHRLPDIEADLVKAESALLIDAMASEIIKGIRADVMFYTGHYAQAKDAYIELESTNASVINSSRLAHYYAHTGDYLEAEKWFEKAAVLVTGRSPHLRSWLHLQSGILDLQQGRLNDALVHYQAGLKEFPGYWLLEEHVAEIDALQGRDVAAERKYRDLIQRTGSPMFMSALADILETRSNRVDQAESVSWRKMANQSYNQVIEKMPELMSGHALEHFLHSGDSERALQLAIDNYQLRPNSQAGLLLSQTYLALGRVSEASALLDTVLKTPFRSAELYATAGVLYRVLGDGQRADQQDTLATNISPLALQEISWLRNKLEIY